MRKRKTAMIKAFVLMASLVFATSGFSQNDCQCKAATQQQLDELIAADDSAAIYRMAASLQKNNDQNCEVMAVNLLVDYLFHHRKKAEGLKLVQDQEKQIATAPCKDELAINSYLNYARCYKAKEDYENLSLYAFKALEHAELYKNPTNELAAIKYIVHLFTRQNQESKNWDYIKRAEKIIMSLPKDYYTAINYNWLAFEYETKYASTERVTLLDSSLAFAATAKQYALQYNQFEPLAMSFRAYEACSYHKGNIRAAVAFMDSALYYAKKIKVPTNLSSMYLAKAWDLVDLKEFSEAMRWQDTSIYYAEKLEPGSPATMMIYSEASQIFETAGSLPKAYTAFKKYAAIRDSVFKMQRSEKINELEQKYEKTKNEKTIKELAQEKRIYLLLALTGLLLLVALVFFIRQQTLKNKQKIMETEQRLNRARMNPHFFFNALSSLQSFALLENDGKALASNLSKFSHIMRETLESTYKEYVTIEQEADFLEEYLGLQKIRFPEKFSYEIRIADTIEADDMLIPSMILQPFVENSIEHGFPGIDYPGLVTILFSRDAKDLNITITDNGKGLANIPKENSEHISRASQIIKDRIFLLNIKLKTRASFSVDNNKQGPGVQVKIMLPALYKDDIKTE